MDTKLIKAAVDAGILDLDCLKMLPDSDASPDERVAALQHERPYLFATVDARTMSPEVYKEARQQMIRGVHAKGAAQQSARSIERIEAKYRRA